MELMVLVASDGYFYGSIFVSSDFGNAKSDFFCFYGLTGF